MNIKIKALRTIEGVGNISPLIEKGKIYNARFFMGEVFLKIEDLGITHHLLSSDCEILKTPFWKKLCYLFNIYKGLK